MELTYWTPISKIRSKMKQQLTYFQGPNREKRWLTNLGLYLPLRNFRVWGLNPEEFHGLRTIPWKTLRSFDPTIKNSNILDGGTQILNRIAQWDASTKPRSILVLQDLGILYATALRPDCNSSGISIYKAGILQGMDLQCQCPWQGVQIFMYPFVHVALCQVRTVVRTDRAAQVNA